MNEKEGITMNLATHRLSCNLITCSIVANVAIVNAIEDISFLI